VSRGNLWTVVDAAGRRAYRYGRRFAVVGVIVAVVVVSVDDRSRSGGESWAETEGGKWLDRKMAIGRLGIHIGSGASSWKICASRHVSQRATLARGQPARRRVELERAPAPRSAARFDQMTDWRMTVETFPDSRQTFPRLNSPPRKPHRPPLVVTTMQHVRAHHGELIFSDYGSDGAVARIDITVTKGPNAAARPLHQRHHRDPSRTDDRGHDGGLQGRRQ
jgi:hypothetical protein